MKGIVFTELIEMLQATFGADMVDDVLDECDLESGGAYTSVGTYDHNELLKIVGSLSQKTGIPAKELVYQYGQYLFARFHDLMPEFFEEPGSAFEFLESVHGYIHVEVKKLYPDAALPSFETERRGHDTLIMVYTSKCPFADFAGGLMAGCIGFYKEAIKVESEDHNTEGQYKRIFTLTKQ